jgi:hypothetical protein
MFRLQKFVGAYYILLVRVMSIRVTVSTFEKTRDKSPVTFYFLI